MTIEVNQFFERLIEVTKAEHPEMSYKDIVEAILFDWYSGEINKMEDNDDSL